MIVDSKIEVADLLIGEKFKFKDGTPRWFIGFINGRLHYMLGLDAIISSIWASPPLLLNIYTKNTFISYAEYLKFIEEKNKKL